MTAGRPSNCWLCAKQGTKDAKEQTHPAKSKGEAAATPSDPAKRNFLSLAMKDVVSAGVASVTGFFAVRSAQASLYERGLTGWPDGRLMVVQIHDPPCSTCKALQKAARGALDCSGECEIQYLAADIKPDHGQIFARQYSVLHVTLMLFDQDAWHTPDGKRRARNRRSNAPLHCTS